ncbi:uncharacterized protein BXZ73DRAFT_52250 [Epithele typhae]|uniref:uncharacterized protein n=1 Tax=Epithele typhae TaxID=378194 RepID=UPI0020077540|nr:uncharacterized protein BXZ73DRAFT_52250 [Epithele typhae]KAH9920199.1 hypothetical protein BXZ73DRAFT_52250 [Epithele typhae]
MNRHHPYGASYEGGGPRRGGPPGNFGPGPDRSHYSDRGGGGPRGRGFGRGRGRGGGQGHFGGGGAGYNHRNAGPYDQGPPQGDTGDYNSYYESGPPPPPPPSYYQQNGNYDGPPGPGQYNPDPPGYDQGGYGYEDGPDQSYGQGAFSSNRPFKQRPPRREREDKAHDSIIEERIQRERPCRTLFIRNIKASPTSDDVRRLFEEHGEIKTFFDLIGNRGMVFVTFYDIRAAERARDRLQGSEISGRPIDVHYSLPRDDNGKGADRQRDQDLQGNLLVTLRDSATNQPIDENEVRRKFQQLGEVKSVRRVMERADQCYIEYFDTRICEDAHNRLRHQGLQDGIMEIAYASPTDDPRGGGAGGGGGGGGGGGYGGGNDWDDRRNFRDNNRGPQDEFGRTQRSGEFTNHRGGQGGYGGGPPGNMGPGYGGPAGGYNQPPPSIPSAEVY